jgi:hypothetical protein
MFDQSYFDNMFSNATARTELPASNKKGGSEKKSSGFGGGGGGMGAAGGQLVSRIGARGGEGTGGTFTQMGASTGNWIATVVGVVLDLGLSSSMADRAKKKAEKKAKAFWADATSELNQMRKGMAQEISGTTSEMGASGASVRSGSFMTYRAAQQQEQNVMYGRQYNQFKDIYKQIKKSGGKGGLF